MVQAPESNGSTARPATSTTKPTDNKRRSFFGSIKKAAGVGLGIANSSLAAVPTAPDGLHHAQAKAASDANPAVGILDGLVHDLVEGRLDDNALTVLQGLREATDPMDDRDLLLEGVVVSSAAGRLGGAPLT